MAPSIKQHESHGAVYQWSGFAFHFISQLVQNFRISRCRQWDTPRDIFPSSVCDSVWVTMFTCFAVGSSRDQWKHSADRLTHTKALCHYRDQTVQGHRLSLLLLPLKKCCACPPHSDKYRYMIRHFQAPYRRNFGLSTRLLMVPVFRKLREHKCTWGTL